MKTSLANFAILFSASAVCSAAHVVNVEEAIKRSQGFVIVEIDKGEATSSSQNFHYQGRLRAAAANAAGLKVCLEGGLNLKVGGQYFVATFSSANLQHSVADKTKCQRSYDAGKQGAVAFEIVDRMGHQFVKIDNINYVYPDAGLSGIFSVYMTAPQGDNKGVAVSALVPFDAFYQYLTSLGKLHDR